MPWYVKHSDTAKVPRVIGMNYIDAKNIIEEAGEIEEAETVQKVEQTENVQSKFAKEVAPQTEKLTPAQMHEKVLSDFTNRYEYLLARGFALENEDENELAEMNQ